MILRGIIHRLFKHEKKYSQMLKTSLDKTIVYLECYHCGYKSHGISNKGYTPDSRSNHSRSGGVGNP